MIDLFSGIGGFSLAAKIAWENNVETVFFCEKDKFCQAVLRKNFGQHIEIVEDIHDAPKFRTNEPIDIICGGFPCQPFSFAGKRKGKADDRYLWPSMLETIETFRPDWVLAENVAGIVNMELDKVLSDLEDQAYTCQTLIIPACAVNAPHRRDRVWIVGYSSKPGTTKKREVSGKGERYKESTHTLGTDVITTDSNFGGIRRHEREGIKGRTTSCGSWSENWVKVATRLCGMDDGLPAGMDGLKLSKSRHRIERLKALGNAIVPQVAAEIFKAMNYKHERIRK